MQTNKKTHCARLHRPLLGRPVRRHRCGRLRRLLRRHRRAGRSPKLPIYSPSSSRKKEPFSGKSVIEIGESSNSKADGGEIAEPPPTFMCEICAESKDVDDSFHVQGCIHSYCKECVGSPRWDAVVDWSPSIVRGILPQEVFDRWGTALYEALILGSEKFYCPFKDCSALLINDGSVMITESECPYCNRLFCARCKVSWHDGIKCEEFQKLNKDEREMEDILLKNLATRCCFFMQKVDGCVFVKCRCGVTFCYRCGLQLKRSHYYCAHCKI